jgi:hypothetical protein
VPSPLPGQQGQQGQQGQRGQQGQQGQQGQGGQGGGQTLANSGGRPRDGSPSGDAQQARGEFRLRRQNAEALRKELADQGVDVRELDRAIEDLRQLESGRLMGDPQGLAQLQASVIEGLKTFEFALFRSYGLGSENRPALGARAPVPAEYRALVEEYYRSLANDRKKP